MWQQYKIIIVGAGFFGVTLAERIANDAGVPVIVLDKRSHVGGNSWSEIDSETGIEHHVYGSHLFHTNSEEVWQYVRQFTDFTDYKHRVLTIHRGGVFSMPINLSTICAYFGKYLSPSEARTLIETEIARENISNPTNLEEKAISLIGRSLYEAFIKNYTAKQWQTKPNQLPSSVITRLPVRWKFDDRYFSDRFEGLPSVGYGKMVQNMLRHPNIQVALNTDYWDVAHQITQDQLVVYTGPIDRFFEYRCGRLGWRTLDFEREALSVDDFQGTAVMNYADTDVAFTRIHEFKHLHPERRHELGKTFIAREFSRFAKRDDEPYYPIGTAEDRKIFMEYRSLAKKTENFIFAGRLGSYRYIDMHQAIGAALRTYEQRIKPFLRAEKCEASIESEIDAVV